MNVVLLVNEASGSGTDAADLEAALRAEGADVRRLPLDRSGEAAAAGLDLPPGERLNVDGELVEPAPRATVEPGRFQLVVG